jgi:hypothetical protein
MAKESAEKYIGDNNSKEIEISNIVTNTKFVNDSLCIIDAVYDVKVLDDEKHQKTVDYVYLIHSHNAYEAIRNEVFDDIVFLSKDEFEKKRIGEIYEELNYEDALYYLASILINKHGRQVDNHNKDVNIPTPFGNWELYTVEDVFGDMTTKKYIGTKGKGTTSVNANKNIDMTVYLFIRDEEVFFKFHLGDLQYVCDFDLPIIMKIKDSEGKVYSFDFICKNNGEIRLRTENNNKQLYHQFISILEKEGIVSGSTEIHHSPYKFKIDITGYHNILKRL